MRVTSAIGSIVETGELASSPGVSFQNMRILGNYALVFLTSGGGRYQLEGQPPKGCCEGDLLVVFPEIAHAYGPPPGGDWAEMYVVFEGPVFDLWRRHGVLSVSQPILRPKPSALHLKRFRAILESSEGVHPVAQLARVCALQSFLAEVLASISPEEEVSGLHRWPAWLIASLDSMESDPCITLGELAQAAGISYESFRKKFRDQTGQSPAQYRAALTFARARKLIYEERLSNQELADRLGFCDEFHFSKRFKQMTGQTPADFRRSLPQH